MPSLLSRSLVTTFVLEPVLIREKCHGGEVFFRQTRRKAQEYLRIPSIFNAVWRNHYRRYGVASYENRFLSMVILGQFKIHWIPVDILTGFASGYMNMSPLNTDTDLDAIKKDFDGSIHVTKSNLRKEEFL